MKKMVPGTGVPLLAACVLLSGNVQAGDGGTADADAGYDTHAAAAAAPAGGAVMAPGMGGMPGPADGSDNLDSDTQLQRLGGVIGVGAVGVVAMKAVGGAARSAVSFGKVNDIPIYGKAITGLPTWGTNLPVYGSFLGKVPLIGHAAGMATIPTTLGQMPFLGPAVAKIPLAGPVIAGPPNPVVVGAVALDTYLAPKMAPCGYTPSSEFTMTDFNSPPRLRHYVNYVAPLPYTHPPIYAPATLNTGDTPNTANAQPEPDEGAVVRLPE